MRCWSWYCFYPFDDIVQPKTRPMGPPVHKPRAEGDLSNIPTTTCPAQDFTTCAIRPEISGTSFNPVPFSLFYHRFLRNTDALTLIILLTDAVQQPTVTSHSVHKCGHLVHLDCPTHLLSPETSQMLV